MGKDNTGKYHPPKGKPSGAGKSEGLGIQATEPEKMDEYLDITDKYTTDADTLAPHVPLRHPNRNTEKGQERFKNQQDRQAVGQEEMAFTEERSDVVPEELPGILSREVFADLADYNADHCISIFLNTHKAGVEVNEQFDPILFKNTLQDVANRLKEKGVEQTTIQRLLEPGYDLLRKDDFWRALTPGLAVFIADGYFKYIKMPVAPQEETVVQGSFYVTPLIPSFISKDNFYLLVISKHGAKLFRGDAFGMEFVPVENMPESVDGVKRLSGSDASTYRIGGLGGDGAAAYHGHAGGNPDEKTNIAVYLEAVDDTIWKQVLHTENVPLVLAGVEYLIPIYKSVTDYKHIWETPLTGSHEHEDTQTLFRQVKEVLQPYFSQRLQKALDNYGNKSATELTASDAAEVIPAAHYGRVSHLFVQKGAHIWGSFDENTSELQLLEEQQAESEDLVDHAAIMTFLTGGEVFLLEKDQMPADSPVAAILRY